jgi:hypothetical protein
MSTTGPTGSTGIGIRYIGIKDYEFVVYNSDNSKSSVPIMGNIYCNTGPTGIGVNDITLNNCGDLTTQYSNGDFRPSGKIIYISSDAPTGWIGPTGSRGITGISSSMYIHTGPIGYTGWTGSINVGATGYTGIQGLDNPYFFNGYIGYIGPTVCT